MSNDVREPQILGVGPDVERSFEDSKSALENTPGNQVAGAAKREIASARGRVRAPDSERTVTSPTEAAGPLTPEVDQALARADLLKKPTPVAMPKPQRDKED